MVITYLGTKYHIDTDRLRVYGPNNIGNFTQNLAFQQAQKTLITSIRGEVAVADTSKNLQLSNAS